MKPIRVLIADDHALVRAGLRLLVEGLEGIEVVAEANNGREAIALAAKLRPDVVLMDVIMPELNGLDATARIVAADPSVRVVMLSMSAGEETVLPALRAGATGYLLKDVMPVELELGIRAAAKGETFLCAAVSRHVVDRCFQRTNAADEFYDRLTERQREVLQLVAEGLSSKEIAARLGITVRTAKAHRAQLMEALDIHDIAGLVRYAVRRGLVTP
jgi:DNA-binding NarL/FixJ family response regulator